MSAWSPQIIIFHCNSTYKRRRMIVNVTLCYIWDKVSDENKPFSLSFFPDSVSSETAFLEDFVLGIGDTLEMSCDLDDHTEPINWFKDAVPLTSSNRTRVGQRILRIINISYEDSGIYSCRLSHSNTLLSNYTIRVTGIVVFYVTFALFFWQCHNCVASSILQNKISVSFNKEKTVWKNPNRSCFHSKPYPHLGLAQMPSVTSYRCNEKERNTTDSMVVVRSGIFLSHNQHTILGDANSSTLTVLCRSPLDL